MQQRPLVPGCPFTVTTTTTTTTGTAYCHRRQRRTTTTMQLLFIFAVGCILLLSLVEDVWKSSSSSSSNSINNNIINSNNPVTVQASAVHSTTSLVFRNNRRSATTIATTTTTNTASASSPFSSHTIHDHDGLAFLCRTSTGTTPTPPITIDSVIRSSPYGSSSMNHISDGDDVDCNSSASTVLVVQRSIGNTLLRGALLRIASDLSGGTPLETIKTRVTVTNDNMSTAIQKIIRDGGIPALWTGSSSRTVEGFFVGAMFMLGSTLTKRQLLVWGTSRTTAALAGGLVGGVAQAIVMTPAGLIFTALNDKSKNQTTKNKSSSSKPETAIQIVRRVVAERGILGMYAGMKPMCIRQATNWASRSGFTEIARTTLRLSQYGLLGEIIAGTIGGVGSCWNTPIETIRVYTQRDVSQGIAVKSMVQYWDTIVEEYGYQGLFRGITPRAIQAIWQTVFLVVVPNLMGL